MIWYLNQHWRRVIDIGDHNLCIFLVKLFVTMMNLIKYVDFLSSITILIVIITIITMECLL